ncbi:MAG: amidohydrolase family protein [Desulfobacteraceae bacterium]|nr:amidohydrolase family protein [Desulfobacteraceae bacterium]
MENGRSGKLPRLTEEERRRLMRTAMGEENADLVMTGARLVNVYSGEILQKQCIAICGEWIAYVGTDCGHLIGAGTDVMDLQGRTVIPGLIDGHTHLAWLLPIHEFVIHAMQSGTTAVVTETMEPFPVGGLPGVVDFLDALEGQPIKLWATAPPMMSISRTARGISPEDLGRLLARETVLGLGESYWQAVVLQETDRMLPLFQQTLSAGKCLEGHSAGAGGAKLAAYVASGVSSCHEPIRAEEVLERIRLGLHVMIREGSIRADLESIAAVREAGVDCRRLILVTDGLSPEDLIGKGSMAHVVQKAIRCGFSPVEAVQMATLNVAEHFGVDAIVGGIAPGRQADLVVIPDPETIQPQLVLSRGRVVARDGKSCVPARVHDYRPHSCNSIHLPRPLNPEDFNLRLPPGANPSQVRIMDLVTPLVTRERLAAPALAGDEILADPDADILKVAAVDRTHRPGRCFIGLLRGFGLKKGAFASSAAWDTSDIVVVGANESDMAAAVNRVFAIGGGFVVSVDGETKAEIALPVFGLLSEAPIVSLIGECRKLTTVLRDLGVALPDPLLTLCTLTGQAIPFVRICEEGLVRFKDGRTLGLFDSDEEA